MASLSKIYNHLPIIAYILKKNAEELYETSILGTEFKSNTQLSYNQKMINRDFIFYWLRWILLIPFLLGATVIVSSFLDFILLSIITQPSAEKYKHALDPFITSFISIILTHYIVPNYKSRATISICIIWLMALLSCLIITTFEVKLYGQEFEIKDGGVAIGMILLGLASSCFLLWNKRDIN